MSAIIKFKETDDLCVGQNQLYVMGGDGHPYPEPDALKQVFTSIDFTGESFYDKTLEVLREAGYNVFENMSSEAEYVYTVRQDMFEPVFVRVQKEVIVTGEDFGLDVDYAGFELKTIDMYKLK